jgi:hypothetical protein
MKLIWMLLAFCLCAGSAEAQKKTVKKGTSKTAKGKKSAKKKTTASGTEFEELICYQEGPCTFSIVKGDTLVYDVTAAGNSYKLFIIPMKYAENTISDFNWFTSAPDNRSGHVTINAAALKSSKKYISMPQAGGELKLNDASFLWLCGDNFNEIAKKQTTMTIDNGGAETFTSPEEDAVTSTINYKGKTIEADGFLIENKSEGQPGRKSFWVMNISYNLLFFKADFGNMSMLLTEVREKKATAPVKKKK